MGYQEKTFVRHFSDFGGINNGQPPHARRPGEAISCLNMANDREGNLVGRYGYTNVGTAADNDGNARYWYPLHGIYTYNYFNRITGNPVQKIIGGTPYGLWILNTGTITINPAAGTISSYSVLPSSTDGRIQLSIPQGATSLSYDLTTAVGGIDDTVKYIGEVVIAINSLANWNCTMPTGGAVASGSGTGVTTINVTAGHGLTPGMIVYWEDSSVSTHLAVRKITATTATSFTFLGAANVIGDSYIGSALGASSSIDLVESLPTTTSTSLVLSFSYWQPLIQTVGTYVLEDVKRKNTSFASTGNIAYYIHPDISNGQLFKFDGNREFLAGMPTAPFLQSVTVGGAGNVEAGLHRYIVVLKQVDYQGNIVESNATPAISVTPGVNSQVSVQWNPARGFDGSFMGAASTVNGNQAGVNTITVTAGTTHELQIGDVAYFLDRSSGSYVERNVTGTTSTTITIDGAVVNVNNTDLISNNCRAIIYRTKLGGIEYYEVAQAVSGYANPLTYVDNIADANLGALYIEPEEVHDVLAAGNLLTTHQGLLIASGPRKRYSATILAAPCSIAYSSGENPEYFPPENSFDLPLADGEITGITATPNNSLLAMKIRSVYEVSGELLSFAFSVLLISDQDIGCASHFSIVNLKNNIIWISLKGPVRYFNGIISQDIGENVSGYFQNIFEGEPFVYANGFLEPNRLVPIYSVGTNYATEDLTIWQIPSPLFAGGFSAPGFCAGAYSVLLCLDSRTAFGPNPTWYNWMPNYLSISPGSSDSVNFLNMMGGAAILDGNLYCNGRNNYAASHGQGLGLLFKFHNRTTKAPTKYLLQDFIDPIVYDYIDNWYFDPDLLDKELKQISYYSFNATDFVAATMRLRIYRNFQDPYTATADTDLTVSFSAVTEIYKLVKPRLNKAHSFAFRLTLETREQRPLISSWTYTVAETATRDGYSRQ